MTEAAAILPATFDPLRRFEPSPLCRRALVMGRQLQVATNSARLLAGVEAALPVSSEAPAEVDANDFRWTLIEDTALRRPAPVCPPSLPAWPELSLYSDGQLGYINVGERGFAAVDAKLRQAVAVLPPDLVESNCPLAAVFLATLFQLTAPWLGLTPLACGCVAAGPRAVLILGPPESGKTSSVYAAGALGLEMRADQACFLDGDLGEMRVWGQFWPAVFRPSALGHSPQLRDQVRRFEYQGVPFLGADLFSVSGPTVPVRPIGLVFLDRGGRGQGRLERLSLAERESRLEEFGGLARTSGGGAHRAALLALPAYDLAYGNDPATAAAVYRQLLENGATAAVAS
ncbi:MAG: hypothetical protein ACRD01_12790 [Terriglobales bacterium]